MPRSAARVRAKTQWTLKSLSVERQDFGSHWDKVKNSRYDGSLNDEGLEKMCRFVRVAKSCGVPASEFSSKQMRKPLKWRTGVIKSKTRKLCAKVRALMATRQRVTENHPRSDANEDTRDRADRPDKTAGDPANDQTNRSVTVDNEPQKNDSATYEPWLGPEAMQLRLKPPTNQHEMLLQFATGPAYFPVDLLEAPAQDRYNFHITVVCFEKEASVAQVPVSIPEPYRTACIKRVRSCNPRLKPSTQGCYESIVRCSKKKIPFHLTDLIAMFTFVHYCIGDTGRNRWLWERMKRAGAERFCDPQYQWNIVDGVVRDGQGRSLEHLVTTSLPPPRQQRRFRNEIRPRTGLDEEE